jgi:uncharacterized protein YdeI (YjbR/CyaY-like superfamily)
MKEERQTFYAKDRKAWRGWLQKYHDKKTVVWLIVYHKTSETPSVYYEEAVEEALCFGWIDSKANKRDEESFFLSFYPRKPKGVWSKINKARVKRLIDEGRMTTAGMRMITLAKKTGTWTALNDIDKIKIPADLNAAFKTNKTARENFDKFPPSSRKIILYWISGAKRPETRQKRVDETVRLAEINIRANHYTKKNK